MIVNFGVRGFITALATSFGVRGFITALALFF